MSTDSNKQLVRRYYESIVSTGRLDEVADFVSPDYAEVYDNVRHPLGLEGAMAHITGGARNLSGPATDRRATDRRG